MSDSSRVFSIFSHVLNISRRIHLLNFARQSLAIALTLSLAFPQTVWVDTFSTVNAFSLTSLWAQIKGTASGKEPTLMDPNVLIRPMRPELRAKTRKSRKAKW